MSVLPFGQAMHLVKYMKPLLRNLSLFPPPFRIYASLCSAHMPVTNLYAPPKLAARHIEKAIKIKVNFWLEFG